MSKRIETCDFIKSLSDNDIPCTLALTGSTARGESRTNSAAYDYESDTDILCIVSPPDIEAVLFHKNRQSAAAPLILMSSEALAYPSNAVLSVNFDSLIKDELNLSKPDFTNADTAQFFSYQAQPLAYYSAQLPLATLEVQRRLYSKIAICSLKLLYLANEPDRRSFIYEQELIQLNSPAIENQLIQDIVNREIPDVQLRRTAEHLQNQIAKCPIIMEMSGQLESTRLHFLEKFKYSREIIESVFLENNRLKKADTLFQREH
ncbi:MULTISPECIES: hypothetical protein [Pseudomonas]|uniref:hypothetical protein n=1 Tax=Pseudomonas TaxID=286 RepID=UPI000BA368BC|nr:MULTISPECIES: hypothetical protein [Pseudomonas]MDR9862711.1 hypothetical protein [Pseudomonas baetica]